MREDRTTETMTVDCHNKFMNSWVVTNNLSCTARLKNHKTLPISFSQWRPYQRYITIESR